MSALGFCAGELFATPWMTRVAKTNIDRLKQDNISEVVGQHLEGGPLRLKGPAAV